MFSIRERVALFGGELSVASTEAGSRVSVRVPLERMSKNRPGAGARPAGVQAPGGHEALP